MTFDKFMNIGLKLLKIYQRDHVLQDSCGINLWAGLAQSVERSARNHKVPSLIPVLANSAYE